MKKSEKPIIIYCDGACKGNQNSENLGAWAYTLEWSGYKKEKYGVSENTTNNVMELYSCLMALKAIVNPTGLSVQVFSDSQYLVKGITEWSKNWIKNDWKNSQNKVVENISLWKELLKEIERFELIEFFQVKGHSKDKLNEYVDKLCSKAIKEYRDVGNQ